MIVDKHISQGWENLWYCIYGTEREFYAHYPCCKYKHVESIKKLWEYINGDRKVLNEYKDLDKRREYQRLWQQRKNKNGVLQNNREKMLHHQERGKDDSQCGKA